MRDWTGASVCVMGLGRFGGGLGVTKWLAANGARVLVTDRSDEPALREPLAALEREMGSGRVRVVHGEHDPALLEGVDTLVVNPAVPRPWDNRFIRAARQHGIEVTAEIALVWARLDPARTIAVTGTSGKSTTCAMIHHALRALGHDAILGGNIGGSLLTDLDARSAPPDAIVLELSSAMLHWLLETSAIEGAGPAVACVTGFAPNHLDWHGGLAHYERSKRVLTDALGPGSTAVLGAGLDAWPVPEGARAVRLSDADRVEECAVPGAHNARNAAVARGALRAFVPDAPAHAVEDALRSFPGLGHRLERVGEAGGVVYFDDSKSTVPDATVLAVDAVAERFGRGRVHLIAGGYDKGVDLDAIAALAPDLAGLYTIGATAGAIVERSGAAFNCGTLERAVEAARERAHRGDAVVLSPGCASWDQFEDYRARGRAFRALALADEAGTP